MRKLSLHAFAGIAVLMATAPVYGEDKIGPADTQMLAAEKFAQNAFLGLYSFHNSPPGVKPVKFVDAKAANKFAARNYSLPNVGLTTIKGLTVSYEFVDVSSPVKVNDDGVSVAYAAIQDVRISGQSMAKNCYFGYIFLDMPNGTDNALGATVKEIFTLTEGAKPEDCKFPADLRGTHLALPQDGPKAD